MWQDPKLASVTKRPADWRERKAQRQKYWSMSQGFRFGRKLGDWGRGDEGDSGDERAAADGDTEDAQMQEAIRRSLLDAAGDICSQLLSAWSLLGRAFRRDGSWLHNQLATMRMSSS